MYDSLQFAVLTGFLITDNVYIKVTLLSSYVFRRWYCVITHYSRCCHQYETSRKSLYSRTSLL